MCVRTNLSGDVMRHDQSTNGAELGGAQTARTADGIRANVETLPKVPACLGPPPIIDGEDANAYEQMLAMVIEVVKPVDIMDWMWVRDIVDLEWEILRYRRAKALYVEETAKRPLEYAAVMRDDEDSPTPWPVKLEMSNILGRAVGLADPIGRVERIVTAMEMRRNRAFREIERHRENSNVRSPRPTKQIEDAEFRVIDPNKSVEDHAA
jgi:hypothetical protein